jgi:hypothetical protein
LHRSESFVTNRPENQGLVPQSTQVNLRCEADPSRHSAFRFRAPPFFLVDRATRTFLPMLPPVMEALILLIDVSSFKGDDYIRLATQD